MSTNLKRVLGDIFDQVEEEEDKKADIFDKVDKDDKKKKISFKEYIPPKPIKVDLSYKVIDFIKKEISTNIPKPEKAVEKEPINEAATVEIFKKSFEKSIAEHSSGIKKDKEVAIQKLEKLGEENKELKEELKKLKDDIDKNGQIRYVPISYPHPSGKSGQVMTNDGVRWKWGPIYGGGADAVIPIGDQNTNGSWRIIVDGDSLAVQKLESGTWNEKGGFMP